MSCRSRWKQVKSSWDLRYNSPHVGLNSSVVAGATVVTRCDVTGYARNQQQTPYNILCVMDFRQERFTIFHKSAFCYNFGGRDAVTVFPWSKRKDNVNNSDKKGWNKSWCMYISIFLCVYVSVCVYKRSDVYEWVHTHTYCMLQCLVWKWPYVCGECVCVPACIRTRLCRCMYEWIAVYIGLINFTLMLS